MTSSSNHGGRGGGRGGQPSREGGRGREGEGRGGHSGTTRGGGAGRGRGGITSEQKAQIVISKRPTTIQIASEGTDDIIVAASADEKLQSMASFVLRSDNFTQFNGQRQVRQFVNSCLLNLSNHHNVDTTGILAGLASMNGMARLRELMIKPMHVDVGDDKDTLSFQFVILPLIGVLTRELVCQSTMTSETGLIYSTVYLHRRQFLEEGVLSCMDILLTRGSMTDNSPGGQRLLRDGSSVCHVKSMPCALLAITRLVYQLTKRTQDARIELASVVERLKGQQRRCLLMTADSAENRFINEVLGREVARLGDIIGDAQDSLNRSSQDAAINLLNVRSARAQRGPNMVNLALAFDPPGHLSEDGPRHDNDHIDISNVALLPTEQEITCTRRPFLPSNGIPDAPHFLPPGWRRQLDIHFRLYREDMMDPLRKGLMGFLSALEKAGKGNEMMLLRQKELKKHLDDNISLNVYGNVEFLGMNCTKQLSGSVEISFTQPPQVAGYSTTRRKEFWERSRRRLMMGALVCIARRSTKQAINHQQENDDGYYMRHPPFEMILGVITRRDVDDLSRDKDTARIHVALTDPKQYILMLSSMANKQMQTKQQQSASDAPWFLVESMGGFFESYRPILKALQSCVPASLPFGKYIAPTLADMANIRTGPAVIHVEPPLYASAPQFSFDLSVLLENNIQCRLDVADGGSIRRAEILLQAYSTLDDTQAKALVETLRREVALISGPPGTGKTKIGVDLMRVLLHNKEAMNCGPILCICYTNHALDQFLEHLLDEKIDSIVRIGARSKSDRLEDYNLESLMRNQDKPYGVRQVLRESHDALERASERIKKLEKSLRSPQLEWEYVIPYLMMADPDLLDEFESTSNRNRMYESDDEDEGFTTVEGRRGGGVFHRWAAGTDIEEKKAANKKLSKEARKQAKASANMFTLLSNPDPRTQSSAPVLHRIPDSNRPLHLLTRNIWDMSIPERERLQEAWQGDIQNQMMHEMSRLLNEVQAINRKKDDAFDDVRRGILKKTSVIGMTTSGAAKLQTLVSAVAPKIIICEEAGEVLESHILAALSASTQHLILIGDHLQLRPSIETYNLSSDSRVGENYNLDKSLFERLVTAKPNSLPMSHLTIQRRMRPEISRLIRNTLYPDLEDGEKVFTYPNVSGMGENLFFMDHQHPEDSKDQYGMQSFANTFEVKMVEALAHYLIKNGYDKPGDIAVLTPYLGQLSKLRDCLRNSFMLMIDERDQEQLDLKEEENGMNDAKANINELVNIKKVGLQNHLTLRTIDNYQGEEAKIVIISLVRSNVRDNGSLSGSNTIGFLKSPNRTNVLLSRAQQGMYILGNASLMENSKNGLWPKIIQELRDFGRIDDGLPIVCKNHPNITNIVDDPDIFKIVAPNGGCTAKCGSNMPCGHVCPLHCHPDDREHLIVKCYEPCPRLQPICEHVCPKRCGEKCGNCMEKVSPFVLPCSHVFDNPYCHQATDPSKIRCQVKILPECGHQCPSICGEKCPSSSSFCTECKSDPKTMGMMVDMIMQQTLEEIDVDEDPILVLSCDHALTLSSLDGMMEMNKYYDESMDPKTGDVTYVGKKSLPDEEVRQVSCTLCRKPITGVLRYGRRVKDAQLAQRSKKHQIQQAKAMQRANQAFDVARARIQQNEEAFLKSLLKHASPPYKVPPKAESRIIGKFQNATDAFPQSNFGAINKVYEISDGAEQEWKKLVKPALDVMQTYTAINLKARTSPTKQLFDAAVSHLYRIKTTPTFDSVTGAAVQKSLPEGAETASDVVQACIVECGLPRDGHDGSSFLDSLHERTNVLIFVLGQALAAMEKCGVKTGWYWFVEDLIHCTRWHVSMLRDAALRSHSDRKAAQARLMNMDLVCKRTQWIGRRDLPLDKDLRKLRLGEVDELTAEFMEEHKAIQDHCPLGILEECLVRGGKIEEKMTQAIKVARGEKMYSPLTTEEKVQLIRALEQELHGGGRWHRCPNNHTYVIGECGGAMQRSRCPECQAVVGGGSHTLEQGNTVDAEFETLRRQ
ncbi:hypothetical protein EDD11_000755 [Mortierella claussenii]|nr:hypothetical protein EDD11_000755 [Mortierella claussenii]